MAIDKKKIDLIVQYALLIAGQEDDFASRMLGPIHLLKYVYLADIYHAEKNNGESFSGASWQFYNFGPWSPSVHNRIDLATAAIMAQKYTYNSNYSDDDVIRWSKSDDDVLERLSSEIPSSITIRLKNNIRKLGKDTERLLDFVYKTEPMLNASPNETLDLTLCKPLLIDDIRENIGLRVETLSNKKKKIFSQKLNCLKKNKKIDKKLKPVATSRIDDTFNTGVEWLESLAGESLQESRLIAKFSDDVWKSDTRKGH